MRSTLFFLAAVAFAQSAPEKSAITGSVVSASTGAPLKKVHVWIEPFSPTRGVNGERTVASASTTTDAEGRFSIDAIAPGDYLVHAQRAGYLDQSYGASSPQVVGPPLALNPGETKRDLVLRLTPQSLLYGKVVDEDGDPVPGARVQVFTRREVETAAAESQDDGSFVVGNLSPGRYQVRATYLPIESQQGRERYVPTYLPGPIDVSAGASVQNLVIRLQKSRVYTVRGRVVPAEVASLKLDNSRGFTTGEDGRFQFERVLPGSYEIRAHSEMSPLLGRAGVVVVDADLDGVVIRLSEPATISGQVKGAATGRITIGEQNVGIQSDGRFDFGAFLPGIYSLEVSDLPEGSYVRAVNFAGRPVDDWKIDLASGTGGELLILVSPDAAEISGVVPDAPGAIVQVWPAGSDTARSVMADARGQFRVHSLPPGEYRVAAFQGIDDEAAHDPQFRTQLESSAAKVKLAEKSRERVELKLTR